MSLCIVQLIIYIANLKTTGQGKGVWQPFKTLCKFFDVFCFVRADQMPIYCSLHYFAFTPEVVLTKGRNPIEFHRESGSRNLLDLDNCEVCSTPYSHNPRNWCCIVCSLSRIGYLEFFSLALPCNENVNTSEMALSRQGSHN